MEYGRIIVIVPLNIYRQGNPAPGPRINSYHTNDVSSASGASEPAPSFYNGLDFEINQDDNRLMLTPELEKVADSLTPEQADEFMTRLLHRIDRENPHHLTPEQTVDLAQAAKEIGNREGNISQADFEKKFPRP